MTGQTEMMREFLRQRGAGASATGVRSYGATHTREPDRRETVRGQLEGLLSSGSEYIRGAEQAGKRFAAGRGLMNSSLAAQSSRNAAIQAGLPIASQDAGMYAQAASQNMSEMNAQERALAEVQANAYAAAPVLNNHDWVDAERERDRQHQLTMQEREISLADRARREEQQYGRELTNEERDFLRENRDIGMDFDRENRDIGMDFDREGWDRQDRLLTGERSHQLTMQEREIALSDRARREEQAYGRELTEAERAMVREGWDRDDRRLGDDRDFQREGWDRDDQRAGADRDFQRELIGDDRDFQRDERDRDRQFERGIFDDQRSDRRDENRQAAFTNAFQMMLGTLFSSPEYFRDPQSASGFMEFFSTRFGQLIDSYF